MKSVAFACSVVVAWADLGCQSGCQSNSARMMFSSFNWLNELRMCKCEYRLVASLLGLRSHRDAQMLERLKRIVWPEGVAKNVANRVGTDVKFLANAPLASCRFPKMKPIGRSE